MSKNDSTCIIQGCGKVATTRSWCPMHYQRWRHNGDPLKTKNAPPRPAGDGGFTALGYLVKDVGGVRTYEHVRKAGAALGKKLPQKAHVHHVDYDPGNNENTNLVICPDAAYHRLLHRRTDALNACGNPNWSPCRLCKQYDDPANMYHRPGTADHTHRACRYKYKQKWRDRQRSAGLPYS